MWIINLCFLILDYKFLNYSDWLLFELRLFLLDGVLTKLCGATITKLAKEYLGCFMTASLRY